MFVSGFNIEVSFQSTVEEHYFDIKERDFVVREGTGKLDLFHSLRRILTVTNSQTPDTQTSHLRPQSPKTQTPNA